MYVCRFYTSCSRVRCCHGFVAAGPTTSGMKSTTVGEHRHLPTRNPDSARRPYVMTVFIPGISGRNFF